MFEHKTEYHMPMPRYIRLEDYVVCIDQVHGTMVAKTQSAEFPYQIYITYNDKTSVVLDMPTKEICNKACDKLAESLGAT